MATVGIKCLLQTARNARHLHLSNCINGIKIRKLSNLSYFHNVSPEPIKYQTISETLKELAENQPDKEIFVFSHEDKRLTSRQLFEDVRELASGLLSLGFEPGDHIGLLGSSTHEWLLTYFAAIQAGMVVAALNPASQQAELQYCLNKIKAKGLVTQPSFKDLDYIGSLKAICPELESTDPGCLESDGIPSLSHVITMSYDLFPGAYRFQDVMTSGTSEHREKEEKINKTRESEEPVVIYFTSGTTGYPKGCMLTHLSLVNGMNLAARVLRYHEKDHRMCSSFPFHHSGGAGFTFMTAITSGTQVIVPSPSFDATAALKAMSTEKATVYLGSPTMFIDILRHPQIDEYPLDHLVGGLIGASTISKTVLEEFRDTKGMTEIATTYGLTESFPISICPPDLPFEESVSCDGVVLPHVEVKITNPDTGNMVPFGETGELCTRGFQRLFEYYNDKAATEELFDSLGWLHTGDLATLSEDGKIKIKGRIKDLIIKGGTNIYPPEIENFLLTHPKVLNVQVIGLPDERLGEVICACIKLRDGESCTSEEITQFCDGKISAYKIPNHVVFVDSFPMTSSGKVKKNVLQEDIAKKLLISHVRV